MCFTYLACHTTVDLNYEPEFPCGSSERNRRYFVLFEWLYNVLPFDMMLDFEGKTPSASGLGSNFPFVVEDAFRWDYVFRKFIYSSSIEMFPAVSHVNRIPLTLALTARQLSRSFVQGR